MSMENYNTTQPLETRIGLHDRYSINPQGWHSWMRSRLNLSEVSTVLELGCGTGRLWDGVDRLVLDQLSVVLTDNSKAMLSTVREKFRSYEKFTYQHLDLNSEFILPYQPELLICNHVLYHVDDPRRVLERIRHQVSDSTICVFATNGMTSMHELAKFLPERLGPYPFGSLLSKFTLHSGYSLVHEIFGEAHIYRYPDGLQVDAMGPLLDYIRSLSWDLTNSESREVSELMEDYLKKYGAIYIGKDTGILSNRTLSLPP